MKLRVALTLGMTLASGAALAENAGAVQVLTNQLNISSPNTDAGSNGNPLGELRAGLTQLQPGSAGGGNGNQANAPADGLDLANLLVLQQQSAGNGDSDGNGSAQAGDFLAQSGENRDGSEGEEDSSFNLAGEDNGDRESGGEQDVEGGTTSFTPEADDGDAGGGNTGLSLASLPGLPGTGGDGESAGELEPIQTREEAAAFGENEDLPLIVENQGDQLRIGLRLDGTDGILHDEVVPLFTSEIVLSAEPGLTASAYAEESDDWGLLFAELSQEDQVLGVEGYGDETIDSDRDELGIPN